MIKLMIVPTGGLRREGITSSQLEYMKKIDKTQFQITVIAAHNNAPDVIKEFQDIGCAVLELPDRRKHMRGYCSALKAELKKGYDIIHVHGNSAIMVLELTIAKRENVKVRIVHSRNTMCDHSGIDKLLRPFFYRRYTYAMACGRDAGEWLFPGRPYEVFHNGKDFTRFRFDIEERKEQRKRLGLEGKVVYGHVGNINRQKNHTFLLKVFKEILQRQGNAVLYIMGDGILMDEVKQQTKDMDIADFVIFAGRVSDVDKRLLAMDTMIFPSLFEGLPNVVLEWQAEGLPSLISTTITNECTVTDLVDYLDLADVPLKWAEKAISLKLSDDERERKSKSAIQALTENGFEIDESTRKLERRYRELLKK